MNKTCYYCKEPIEIPDKYHNEYYCCGKCLDEHTDDEDINWNEIDED